MSIQRMRRRFAVQLRVALWALLLAFIIGLPLLFSQARLPTRQEGDRGAAQVLARVEGEPVPKSEAERLFEQQANQLSQYAAAAGEALGLGMLWQLRLAAMEQAIENAIVLQQARDLSVSVSKGDVRQRAEEIAHQEIAYYKSQMDQQRLEQVLAQIVAAEEEREPEPDERMSERQFTKWRRDSYADPARGLRTDMTIEKLRNSVVGQVSVTEEDLRQSYDAATVRRILVSLRPPGGQERTQEEAQARAEGLLARVKGGADFAELARSESDDPAAERTGGLSEHVRRGWRSAEWDQAVFSLQPGEVSGVIAVPQGYEIVKLQELSRELPEDFEERKEQLLGAFARREQDRAWDEYAADLTGKADVEVVDKEMLAYRALAQGKQDEAVALLKESLPQVEESRALAAATMFYELATLLGSRSEWEEAAELYAKSSDALSFGRRRGELVPGGRAESLLGMGRAYENLGEAEEALIWYRAASDMAAVPSIHQQLHLAFQKLGETDLAEKEQEWLDRYEELERERREAFEARQRERAEQDAQPAPPPSSGPTEE